MGMWRCGYGTRIDAWIFDNSGMTKTQRGYESRMEWVANVPEAIDMVLRTISI